MEQLDLFTFPQMEITKPIRLIELFGGIGSQAMALRDIGADFDKAQSSGVSNTQLYKQAGNAIVKQVLMAIFSQMNIKGVKP